MSTRCGKIGILYSSELLECLPKYSLSFAEEFATENPH
jgi:hypothetical protein